MKTLIRNIGKLVGIVPEGTLRKEGPEMGKVGSLDNAWLLIDGEKIDSFGQEGDSRYGTAPEAARIIDAAGGYVMPSFCDSHSHIVYAGSRYGEFRDKIDGLTYEQIAARGGGILNSADLLHKTSEEELFRQSLERAAEVMNMGTGALEIKSGYGLNTEDELKMLRVIRRLRASLPMEIRATFLGAHAVGRAYTGRQGEYVDMVCREMLPAVAAEGLADFVDVFCDSGFFTPEETLQILDAAQAYGLRGKIHANELAVSGGVQAGVSRGALSVDHLLPGASFFSNLPYGRAKDYIRAGLGVALASDYNPGSSPSGDMRFVMALGCIKMKLTPEEAFNACTLNGAYAMGISRLTGSVTAGKLADLIITRPLPDLAFIPYSHHTPFISRIILKGKEL